MKTSLVVLTLTLSALACRQPSAPADCDCQSTSYSLLIEKTGVYNKGGVSTINAKTGQVDGFYTLSCNPDFITGKAADRDTILLTGRARSNCYKGESLIALPSLLELITVRKK
ncbi:hypothetical protein [Spirosoma endbachense]|uniref:Lipoprotein n=1 Tax=Spirosoma endbachense TaxID=2666025 RepID=A0A6P1VRG5_9BACT|nr:hypothetical protein [Spirosoma endbachense]QHV95673.1 hypothetical protein GJR95_11940 [Spirosoma endbachense]